MNERNGLENAVSSLVSFAVSSGSKKMVGVVLAKAAIITLPVILILLLLFLIGYLLYAPLSALDSIFGADEVTQIQNLRAEYGLSNAALDYSSDYGELFENTMLETSKGFPLLYFNQGDKRWCDAVYGAKYKNDGTGDKMATHACGPTALAMVVSSIKKMTILPTEVAEWAYQNGHWIEDGGSMHAMMRAGAEAYGIETYSVSPHGEGGIERIKSALSGGDLAVAIMGKGHFTTVGHFIVIRGYNNETGKILVADPYSFDKTNKEWDVSILVNECQEDNATGAPIWFFKWKDFGFEINAGGKE